MARCSLRMSIQLLGGRRVRLVKAVSVNIARDRRRAPGRRSRSPRGDARADRRSTRRPSSAAADVDAVRHALRPAASAPAARRRARATASVDAARSSSRQSCQVCRPAYWSWPMTRNHSASGSRGAQLAHACRACSSAPRAPSSQRVEHEARLAGDRQRAPSPRGRRPASMRARLLPRLAGRHPAHLVERQLRRARRARARRARRAPGRSCRRRCRCAAAVTRGRPLRRPVARPQEVAVQPRLGRARLGLPVVAPRHDAAASTSGCSRCGRPTAGRTACRGPRPG